MKIDSSDKVIYICDANFSQPDRNHVVTFEISECRKFISVLECCDYFYFADLNKSDMDELIKKLTEMRERME